MDNEMVIRFKSVSQNEGFARVVVGAFAAQINPTLEELSDIKMAVSEAVTNSIIHGYGNAPNGVVEIRARLTGKELYLEISDEGKGIADIVKAREPFYTSCPEMDRSGMGFTVMETFMDTMEVQSGLGQGTTVRMTKRVAVEQSIGAKC